MSFADINGNGIINESTEILQENHYYPFGMNMEGLQTPQVGTNNKYQYNGKELNDDFGLGWLDYGARWYDASIARWSAVDPLAEEMNTWSPYNYTFCNPIGFIDPDGRAPTPPTLLGMFNRLSKSKTFRKLSKRANVTRNNLNNVVKWTNKLGTNTNPGNGIISINENSKTPITGMIHEVSNKAQFKKIKEATFEVTYGGDSPKDYAEKIIDIESESLANQVIVLTESGEKVNNEGLMAIVAEYENGEMSKSDIKEMSKQLITQGKASNEDGAEMSNLYEMQGRVYKKQGEQIIQRVKQRYGQKGVKKRIKQEKKKMKNQIKKVLN